MHASVFQKFASVCSCQWKWKDVCSCSRENYFRNPDWKCDLWTHLRWSTRVCFAKPTPLKPTRLSVRERDLMLWGARASFPCPSLIRWAPWVPALSWTWCSPSSACVWSPWRSGFSWTLFSPSSACRWSPCALLWVGLCIQPLLHAGDHHGVLDWVGLKLCLLLRAGDPHAMPWWSPACRLQREGQGVELGVHLRCVHRSHFQSGFLN